MGCTLQELPPQADQTEKTSRKTSLESIDVSLSAMEPKNELRDDTSTESAYRVVYEDDAAFLFRGNDKILALPLLAWLGGEEKFDPELWWGVDIWFQRDQDNKTMLYLKTMRECGGCIWYERDYMIIDNETLEISRGKIPSIGDQERFPGLGFKFIFTHDKHKAAAVHSTITSEPEPEEQSVYVFDFDANKVEKKLDIPEGQLVLNRVGHGSLCVISDHSLYWDDPTGELIINPVNAEDVGYGDCYSEEYQI